ncbi:MAG: FKBP-type peptidyl-prolyl cis-trans isomerase N-terminal domain-containing protein [Bacteroidales bacterium]
MKKSILFSAVFATSVAALSLTSCNNCGSSCALSNEVDSVSYSEGVLIGNMYAAQIKNDTKIDVKEFIKGFKSALNADSSEYSYRIGSILGTNIQMSLKRESEMSGSEVNKKVLLEAFTKVIKGDSTTIKQQDAQMIYQNFMENAYKKKSAEEETKLAESTEAKANKTKGESFLTAKSKESGVKKTASGLMYKVIKDGKGEKAKADSKIKMNYRGTLIDGKEFDKGEGATGRADQFVPGFSEGLQLMAPGAKYELYIPAELAYGVRGSGDKIPANSVIVFEVELLEVQ